MSDKALRSGLIRLASTHPEFRSDILKVLKEAGCEKLPEGGMRDNCEKKKEEGKDNKEDAKGKEASRRRAQFDAADIGGLSLPEGVANSDADKDWMDGEFSQQEFSELDIKQEDGDLLSGDGSMTPLKMASDKALRTNLIRLASTHPQFRSILLPLLRK